MRNALMQTAVALLLFCLPAWSAPADVCAGQEEAAETTGYRFSLDLVGGYVPLPMLDYRYDLTVYTDRQRFCHADDESTLEPGATYGLSLGYYPTGQWLNFGLIAEALYARFDGELTGKVGCPSSASRTYRSDQELSFYQLNALARIYFTSSLLKPFVELGLGALRVDAAIDDYSQTSYGITGLMGWGVEWRVHDRVGVSLQARLADHFALVYYYEPSAGEQVAIQAQYIPLTALFKTQFYFF